MKVTGTVAQQRGMPLEKQKILRFRCVAKNTFFPCMSHFFRYALQVVIGDRVRRWAVGLITPRAGPSIRSGFVPVCEVRTAQRSERREVSWLENVVAEVFYRRIIFGDMRI